MKITKKRYLQGFAATVAFLALVRVVFPGVARSQSPGDVSVADTTLCAKADLSALPHVSDGRGAAKWYNADGSLVKNRIYSVPAFKTTFPDSNSVQMVAAKKYGVSLVKNRKEAEQRKKELVFVGANPYFHIDKLNNSIPYLVPRASVLIQVIGKAFFDSLTIKGIPLHKIIVTSVLRTQDDVQKLRNRNMNATENSCHLYGTTFDLCYNRYITVEDPEGPARRAVRNDTLKWVLSEVLRDFRQQKRRYIKYEVKQGSFHMTVN